MKLNINLFFPLFLILFSYSLSGIVEIIEEGSKYQNEKYINLFKIPKDMIEAHTNAGEFHKLEEAFNENSNSFWLSVGKFGEEYTDTSTHFKYDSLVPNITITFNKKVLINRLIYKAFSYTRCDEGIGYPKILKVYYKNRDSKGNLSINDNDFVLVDTIISQGTKEKVVFSFEKDIFCDQLKLEWKDIHSCAMDGYDGKIAITELGLLTKENEIVNEDIINAFDKSDYRELVLSKEYQSKEKINLLKEELKTYDFSNSIKSYLERIIGVFNGSIVYDPRREFTTDQTAEFNKIYQRGDVSKYSKNTLKMWRGGTNRQITGIYAKSNETITIYVSSEGNNYLPCFIFTQFFGASKNWLGDSYCISKEKESFKATDFKTDDYSVPVKPGGPIYFTNTNLPEMQGQKTKIYIEGGTVFPVMRVDEDEKKYMEFMDAYVKLVNKDNITYPDITEFYGNRVMISVRATQAYKIYKEENKSPLNNLLNWDIYMKKLYIYDGLQFEKDQPYYNVMNNYICIHIRYSQPYALAYAGNEHIGIYYDDWVERAIYIDEKEIGWGFPHEIGHMMDINERTVSETSNNMISKYSETYLQGDGSWGPDRQNTKIKYLTPDDTDNKLRGCKEEDESKCYGFFKNVELNYLIWWDLESMFHGYWGKLDNMYRFNSSLATGLSKVEKFVYFTNLILGMDLGYYFTRWGFYLNDYQRTFNESEVSSKYEELMFKAEVNGLIDINIPQKKYWYFDYKQYNYMNDIGLGCYENQDEYVIKISSIEFREIFGRIITLENVKCPGHLGFEVYERDRLIGFAHGFIFIDDKEYENGYVPKYRAIAYDRLLYASKPSAYKSMEDDVFLYGIGDN